MIDSVDNISEIVESFSNDVFRICRLHTQSHDEAWDAFQETFVVLTRRQHELNLATDPRPWLFETARRCCLSVSRKRRRSIQQASGDLPDVPGHETNNVAIAESHQILAEEIDRLPTQDQTLLTLLYKDGKTHREAAVLTGVPAGSICASVKRIQSYLRKRLRKRNLYIAQLLFTFLLHSTAEAGSTRAFESKAPVRDRFKWQNAVLGTVLTTLIATAVGSALASPFYDQSAQSDMTDVETVDDAANADASIAPEYEVPMCSSQRYHQN